MKICKWRISSRSIVLSLDKSITFPKCPSFEDFKNFLDGIIMCDNVRKMVNAFKRCRTQLTLFTILQMFSEIIVSQHSQLYTQIS